MSFLERQGAGRRRITHMTNDEWRAALQQQVLEKQQRQVAQQPHSHSNGGTDDDMCAQQQQSETVSADAMTSRTDTAAGLPRMGRRGVQQLSREQWREALEQQIREKHQSKQQDAIAEHPSRRSRSAPQQADNEHQTGSSPEQQRAATTSAGSGDLALAGGRNRCRRPAPLSHEEYLQGLQQQIQEKKRLEQATDDKKQTCRSRPCTPEDCGARNDDEHRQEDQNHAEEESLLDASRLESEEQAQTLLAVNSSSPNQQESDSAHVTPVQLPTDPTAISKIVDFCEELKRQNEDVKQQLQQQHSVLARLAADVQGTVTADTGKKKDGRNRSALKQQTAPGKPSQRDASVAGPRPRPSRGASKIPLPRTSSSLLRAAGAQIVRLVSVEETQSAGRPEPEDVAVLRSTSKSKAPVDVSRTSSQAKKQMQLDDDRAAGPAQVHTKALDERPLAGDSEFVRHWTAETELELPNCTSDAMLSGPSALVPLERSFTAVFQ